MKEAADTKASECPVCNGTAYPVLMQPVQPCRPECDSNCGADAGVLYDLIEHDGNDLRDLPLIRAQAAARQTARQGQAALHPVQRASDG